MKDIQCVKRQLEEGVDPSLLTKAGARIADRYLIVRNVRGRLAITLNDKAILFDWFDAIQETTVDSPIGRARWRTETTERDRLFLTKLGVLGS